MNYTIDITEQTHEEDSMYRGESDFVRGTINGAEFVFNMKGSFPYYYADRPQEWPTITIPNASGQTRRATKAETQAIIQAC